MQIPWPRSGLNQNIRGPTPQGTDTTRPGTDMWGPLAAAGEVRLQNNNETRLKDTAVSLPQERRAQRSSTGKDHRLTKGLAA